MKPLSKLGRRLFLGGAAGAAGAAASLPVLRSLTESKGKAADTFPKRLVVWFTPNGTVGEQWFPQSGGENDFVLGRILKPIEDAGFRDKMLVMNGLDMKSTAAGPGDGHQKGMGHMLTGTELLPGDVTGGCDSCAPAGVAGGISIDQAIANQIAGDTPYRSLELGIRSADHVDAWTRMSYRGPDDPLPPEADPRTAFERVFAGFSNDPAEDNKRRAMRMSVVDGVKRDFGALEGKLSGADKKKLESHLESVRDIERRLGSINSCGLPDVGAFVDRPDQNANIRTVMEQQIKLGVMAMACDLTRVVSFQISNSVGGNVLDFLNVGGNALTTNHHAISHEDEVLPYNYREALTEINRWYAQQFTSMLTQMDAIEEGDGRSMLDNSVVLWVNELSDGRKHNHDDMPFRMGGSAGGHFRTGRYLQFNGVPHNNLFVSLQQAYGVNSNTFGNPNFCTGPLTGLV